MQAEKFEKCGIAEVFLDVGVLGKVFCVNFGNR
jgi:hypothetical protein